MFTETTLFFLARLTGGAGFLLNLLSNASTCDKKLTLYASLSSLLWSLQAFILGAYAGAISGLLLMALCLFKVRFSQYINYFSIGLIFLLLIATTTILFRTPGDLFLPFAHALLILGFATQSHYSLRFIILLANILFLGFGFWFESYEQIISSFLNLGALFVGSFRLYWQEKKSINSSTETISDTSPS